MSKLVVIKVDFEKVFILFAKLSSESPPTKPNPKLSDLSVNFIAKALLDHFLASSRVIVVVVNSLPVDQVLHTLFD